MITTVTGKHQITIPAKLAAAIAASSTEDNRAELGRKRGGRKLALDIRKKVLAAAAK